MLHTFSILVFTQCLAATPYPPSPVVKGITLDWSTHQRHAPGSDNFQLTWADDGHMYGAWGDGGGFGGTNRLGRTKLGVARIEGAAASYQGFNVWGGHKAEHEARFDGKSWGMICVNQILYMWVVPDVPEGKKYRNHYEYVEMAVSTDHAATWSKLPWKFRQSEGLTVPTFLNFGQDNQGVPADFGEYVYSYFLRPESPDIEQQGPRGVGLIVHKPGVIYLARVRAGEMRSETRNHEFFCGLDRDGQPRWGPAAAKRPVFEDPNGVGWCLSASYNPHLKRVILCTEHGTSRQSILGIFDAPYPWGPWTTITYHENDSPFGRQRPGSSLPWRKNVFFLAFPTKWLDEDAFTLNFTGAGEGRDNDSFNTVRGRFRINASSAPDPCCQ